MLSGLVLRGPTGAVNSTPAVALGAFLSIGLYGTAIMCRLLMYITGLNMHRELSLSRTVILKKLSWTEAKIDN